MTSAAAIAVVSAGAGAVVLTTSTTVRPRAVWPTRLATVPGQSAHPPPRAAAAPGSVEQVAAKVLPSVVKLQIDMGGGQSEEGSGIVLSSDGLDPDEQPRRGRAPTSRAGIAGGTRRPVASAGRTTGRPEGQGPSAGARPP